MLLLAQESAAGGLTSLLLPALVLGGLYFVLIRPQRKRQREREDMVGALSVGDDVVTIGGIHGTVEALDEDTVDLLVTEDVLIRVTRSAIGSVATSEPGDDDVVQPDPIMDDEDEAAGTPDDDQA